MYGMKHMKTDVGVGGWVGVTVNVVFIKNIYTYIYILHFVVQSQASEETYVPPWIG